MIPRVNSSPESALDRRRRSSDDESTVLPLTVVMTSPAFTPALAAAESASTEETSTPSFVPKYSASCGDRSWMPIPSLLPERQKKVSSDGGSARGGDGGCGADGGTGAGGGVGGTTPSQLSSSKNRKLFPSRGVTLRLTRWPSRITAAVTVRPAGVSETSLVNCRTLRTRS